MKIQGPWFQRNYIIARDEKVILHGTSFQSSPKITRMLITKPICIQKKFTTADHCSFANYVDSYFFPTTELCSLLPKQSTLSSSRICGLTHSGKSLNLLFLKLSLQNMRCFDHATILGPSCHGLCKECHPQWPPFVSKIRKRDLYYINLTLIQLIRRMSF